VVQEHVERLGEILLLARRVTCERAVVGWEVESRNRSGRNYRNKEGKEERKCRWTRQK
jgi:hypothetical protein